MVGVQQEAPFFRLQYVIRSDEGGAATVTDIARLVVFVLALPACVAASGAALEQPVETSARDHWVREHLSGSEAVPPFAFRYGDRDVRDVLTGWTRSVTNAQTDAVLLRCNRTWRDPATGLEARCFIVEYADFPAVEWTVWLKNTGDKPTPMIEDLQALDAHLGGAGRCVLHGIKGDWCDAHSYEPYEIALDPGVVKRFAPPEWSGKSCDGADGWPYFNLQTPGGGVMIAVGWPGQWAASTSIPRRSTWSPTSMNRRHRDASPAPHWCATVCGLNCPRNPPRRC